jgi:hypothetical protein
MTITRANPHGRAQLPESSPSREREREREREVIGGGRSPRRRQGRKVVERAVAGRLSSMEREREREREREKG